MSDSVRPHRWQPTRLLCPRDSPTKNTGVGCHALLQGIQLPDPGIEPASPKSLALRADSLPLSHGESPHTCLCCVLCLVAQSCPTLCDTMDCSPPGSSVHGDSPGKSTGVGCHALLQGIFPSQGLNSGPPTLQADSLPSEPPEKPKMFLVF